MSVPPTPARLAPRALLARRTPRVTVDAEGVRVGGRSDALYDVLFDGRRIWSFWSVRDGHRVAGGRLAAWPGNLAKFLDGHSEITVIDRTSDDEVFRAEVAFTDRPDRIEIVNPDGVPLSLDYLQRLVGTFETRDAGLRGPLLDAIEEALGALRSAGVEAFLAYGTALGAIRDGRLIGHDSDADLGYVSRHDHPVDVIRESFALQRSLQQVGYRITRYSGGAFKIYVPEGDGVHRGLDVFGGYLRDGQLHLLGEIRTPYREDWIHPLGEATLEGRTFPVPRNTDAFLVATYGPHWRTPDPAFKYTTPESTQRMFTGIFRGTRTGRAGWDRFYSRALREPVPEASRLAHDVRRIEPDARAFVDLGCGRGADLELLTRDGASGLGLDFQTRSYQEMATRLGEDGEARDVRFQAFNLLEIRSVLAGSALGARLPEPRILLARHLVDTIGAPARANLWRACGLMLRGAAAEGGGGRLYLEFMAKRGPDGYARAVRVKRRRPREVQRELEAAGAVVESVERYAVSDHPRATKVCRMVVTWPAPGADAPDPDGATAQERG